MRAMSVDVVSLRGGIDRASTVLQVQPGAALDLLNFEPELEGGYRRVNGYERTDGRASPSQAVYYTMGVEEGSAVSINTTITGGTSAATARVVAREGDTIGITALNGTFVLGETVSGTTITVLPELYGLDDADQEADWQLAAENYYRSLIVPLPGTGPVPGAIHFRGLDYAFRATAGELLLYKSSASGWVLVPFYDVLFFDTGVMTDGEITAGTVVTGATSSASGVVKRFIKNKGSYAVDASGYMVLDVTTGTFADGENIQVGGVTKAVADGVSAPITMAGGGKFEFIEHNFAGSTDTIYLYGCDGVNPAWEFDGQTLVPIYFQEPDKDPDWNKPKFICAHKGHLFLAFDGGQVAHSSIGQPVVFSARLGAAEFGLGDTPTGMVARAGNVLAIYTKSMTFGLYGSSAADWELQIISETFGAQPYTVKKVGTVYALDDKGIAPLERVQAYGDFESATVSRFAKPILDEYKGRAIGAVVVKERNQYRLLFDDGTILVMSDDGYLGESLPSFSLLRYPIVPTCMSSNDDPQGREVILFGDADGYVYRAETGYNFDGEPIEFVYRSPFLFQKSPHVRKAYRRLFLDIETTHPVALQVSADLAYGDFNIPTMTTKQVATQGVGGFYDRSNWNEIFWDASTFNARSVSLSGTGRNISILIYGNSAKIRPFTLQTLEIHYLPRRLKRV
jgi:hypothetical protein